MKPIALVAIGNPDEALVDGLRETLASRFGVRARAFPRRIDPAFAYSAERRQYLSPALLEAELSLRNGREVILGVTEVDLFIPILTFVFGESQLNGDCALVSFHRLRQEFYGLPPDDGLLFERAAKEATHELGHVEGLAHCDDYRCVMAASHSVEWIDLKGEAFCEQCLSVAPAASPAKRR